MTHLYIEQNTGLIEEVDTSIISKLYELASSGDLDLTSDLKGRLHTVTAKELHVTYLTQKFSLLYILADMLYMQFADSEVERVLSTLWGNGEGLTLLQTQSYSKIPDFTFMNNTTIESFNELSRLTSIGELGDSCFAGASNLRSIDLSNIEVFRVRCFLECYNLQTITSLSPNITSLPSYCFAYCTNLENVTLPSSCVSLGEGCFEDCNKLRFSAEDLLNVTIIQGGRDHFLFKLFQETAEERSNITSENLYLPNLRNLGFGGFSGQRTITTINLPNLTTLHGGAVFNNCKNLTTVISLGNITTFDVSDTFYSYRAGLFAECTKLTSVTLPPNLDMLPYHIFKGCIRLSNINIPLTIEYIGSGAFANADSLTNKVFYFPNVTKIGATETWGNSSNLSIYLPKLNAFKNIDSDRSYSDSVPRYDWGMVSGFVYQNVNGNSYIPLGHNIVNVMYFRDITYFPAAYFFGCNIKAIIINNTTIPTLTASTIQELINDNHNFNDTIFAGNSYIGNIYVPDSAVNDYKASPLFADVISKIKPISECPVITLQQAESGETGIITDYM